MASRSRPFASLRVRPHWEGVVGRTPSRMAVSTVGDETRGQDMVRGCRTATPIPCNLLLVACTFRKVERVPVRQSPGPCPGRPLLLPGVRANARTPATCDGLHRREVPGNKPLQEMCPDVNPKGRGGLGGEVSRPTPDRAPR